MGHDDADRRFCGEYPNHQNALDLYAGAWISSMPAGSGLSAGTIETLNDVRVIWAADRLGGLAGRTILELGPCEAYNTHQFEMMGAASVVAIDNNRDNFLKCLIIKNILGLRTTFLLGDMIKYLHATNARYDICWASGLLYHMTDPVSFLRGIARISKTLFIWTHYVDVTRTDDPDAPNFDRSKDRTIEFGGRAIRMHHRNYPQTAGAIFSGGSSLFSYWMEKEDIFHILRSLGFSRTEIGVDNPAHPPGAACFFVAYAD